jgi:hypothetical protein
MHARNVYLVLNLITGCVSPQYHCCFDAFFETTHHGAPDVSGTICWQQLAYLDCTTAVLSNFQGVSAKTAQCYILRDAVQGKIPYYEQTHLCAAYIQCNIG